MMIKNFGKFKQWTGERLGQAKATLQTEDFQQLVTETDTRRPEFSKVHEATEQVFHQLTKKKPSPEDGKTKCTHWEALANCWISYGKTFPDDNLLGVTLINFGQTQGRLASFSDMFTYQLKDGYMITLQQGIQLYKDYDVLKKKLESRRLDYDAKLARLQKSKKEKPEFEQEMQAAKIKYEETEYDLIQKMIAIQEYEEDQYNSLVQFMEAQLAYHQQVIDIITDVQVRMNDNNNMINPMKQQQNGIRPIPTRTQTAPTQLTMNGNIDDYGSSTSSLSSSPVIRNASISGPSSSRFPPPMKTASRQPSVDNFHPLRHTSSRSSFNSQSNNEDDSYQQQPTSTSPTKLPPSYPRRKSSTSNNNNMNNNNNNSNKKLRKAIFDFQAESNDELSFHIGDIITVVEPVDEGWWWGEMENQGMKHKGIFPVNYTEEYLSPAPPIMPARPTSTATTTSSIHSNVFSDHHQSIEEEPHEDRDVFSNHQHYNNNNNSNNKYTSPTPSSSSSPYIRPNLISRSSSTSSSSISRANTPIINNQTKPILSSTTITTSSSTRTPPPPPPSSTSSTTGIHRANTTKSISSSTRTPPPPPPSSKYHQPSSIKQPQSSLPSTTSCQECDCDDYSANLFKKGYCNNCFHKHD
ncbi:unnamed protein product [Cunninghamella blakesleeana]